MEITRKMENEHDKTRLKILNESDPYIIMGVSDDSPIEEIIKNYKELAKEFHPDRHIKSDPQLKKEIEVLFTKITTAFNLLKDTEERKKFDYEKKMRLEREVILDQIKNSPQKQNFNPSKTQPGGINISNLFTDKKLNNQEIKHQKAENLYHRSLVKYNNGEFDSAIADLQAAIELNSKVARYHSSLGLVMKEKGWNGYAMAEFKIALSIDPNDNLALEHKNTGTLTNNTSPLNKNFNPAKKDKSETGILDKVKNLFKKS